jgi:hypothetical protein
MKCTVKDLVLVVLFSIKSCFIIIGDIFSAWYNEDGTLKDCEKIIGRKNYPVSKSHTVILAELKRLGPIWKNQ